MTDDRIADRSRYVLPPVWEVAIAGWIAWLRIGGARPATLRLRRGCIRMIARRTAATDPNLITLDDLVELFNLFDWSNDHRKAVRTAAVSFYDWATRNGYAEHNPAAFLPEVKGRAPRPRPATDDVWQDVLRKAAPRERLMIRLAGEAGLRRAEVAVSHRNDLIEYPTGCSLIVHGKGGKQRVVPISDDLAQCIREFTPNGGYVFPGEIDGHISADHTGVLISRLMPQGFSMHTLRHRFATRAYRGSRNLRAVQELLGHASVATTQRYTAVDDDEIRAAMMAAQP